MVGADCLESGCGAVMPSRINGEFAVGLLANHDSVSTFRPCLSVSNVYKQEDNDVFVDAYCANFALAVDECWE